MIMLMSVLTVREKNNWFQKECFYEDKKAQVVRKNAQGRSKQSPFAASLDKLTLYLILFLCVQTEFKLEGIYLHIKSERGWPHQEL